MRALVISPGIPFPAVGGGALRTFHLLRHLVQRFEVTVLGFTWDALPTAAPFPITVKTVPWRSPDLYRQMEGPDSAAGEAFEKLSSGPHPWFVSYYRLPEFEEAIHAVCPVEFDLILIEHTFMAQYLPLLPFGPVKILDLHNIHSFIAQREAELKPADERRVADAEAARTRRFETEACHTVDLCVAVSAQEAERARAMLGLENIGVVPNGVDTTYFAPQDAEPVPGFLLFTGMMNYEPNIQAVQHFVAEIFPQILRKVPHARFHVVGANPPPAITALASDKVTVHGSVPDTRPFFAQAEAVVVPLLHGGGTRLKILEASAAGKAIVSTMLGAEGLGFANGRDLLLADSAEDFAGTVTDLLLCPDRRLELERHARAAALPFDWGMVGTQFLALIDRQLAQRRTAP